MGGTARRVGSAVLVTLLGPTLDIAAAQGDTPPQKPKVAKAVAHDTSRPLREMVGPSTSAQEADQARELPPRDNPSVRERYEQENRVLSMTPDPLRQIVTGQARAPDPTLNVEGPAGDDNFIHHQAPPPDANGDVGPNHWISMVNVLTSIYNKDGSIVLGPFPNRTFWKDFEDRCHYNQRAPIVLHDQLADRWLVSQPGSSGVECVAVSTGPDPTGTFHRYAFQFTDGFSDFPQLGLWPDGYYLSSNGLPRDEVGARPTSNTLCAFERDAMLEGNDAQIVCFQIAPLPNGDEFWLPQPAHLEGMTLPPTGAPHPFIMAYDDEVWGGNPDATQDFYKVWHFSVDWNDTANSTLTGPIDVPTAEFNSNQCGVFGSRKCVPQPDTDEMIDSLALYNSYRAVYRNFGAAHADGAHDSLWINHTVNVDGSGPPGLAGIRWAEVRNPLGNPTEHQAGTWSPPDGDHRFVGSLSVDDSGNMLLAYSVSSEDTFPSIRYAGRLARDPLGQLTQEENELWAGTGSQEYFYEWGRFSTVSLDESDGCSFWITNEYYEDAGEGWKTRVGATRFATCDAAEAGTIAGTLTTRDTGDRLAGVTIRAERGNGDIFETKTDEAGAYAILVPKGAYTVTAWVFGFIAETETGVKVANATATTVNFRLREATRVDVDGFVTDGSGAGWPIYATIVITTEGADALVLHTSPKNGYYLADDLPADVAYTFTVTAITPAGYAPEERTVTTGARDRQENFVLLVDDTCTTPGYTLGDVLLTEDFEATFPPDGWSVNHVTDWCTGEQGNPRWNTKNLIGRDNLTGGSGLFAIADPDACDEAWLTMRTNMITPELDLSDLGENDTIRIAWNHDYYDVGNVARVQGWDGGSWVTVADFSGTNDRGPVRRNVFTTVGAGLTDAKFRWHYEADGSLGWWEVDDVEIRAGSCQFRGGGVILGNVYDANTGHPINGARVEVDTGVVVNTVATPDDPTLDDGFYSLFVPLAEQTAAPGVRTLTVTAPGYTESSRGVIPRPASTERENFQLAAGMLSAEPAALGARVPVGGTATQTLTLSNIGTAALNFDIQEVNFPPLPQAPEGRDRRPASAGAKLEDAGQWVTQFPTNLSGGSGVAWYPPRNTLWISGTAFGGGGTRCFELEPDGTLTGNSINCDFEGDSLGDLTYNPITGTLWIVNVNYDIPGENCLYEIDPVALERTGNRICGPWVYTQDAVAYDPASDTYYVSGDRIWQITPDGTVVRSIITRIDATGLAYNPETQHLFVRDFTLDSQLLVHVLDAADPNLAEIGVIELLDQSGNPISGDFGAGGLTFDCAGNLVTVSGTYQFVFVHSSGESGSFCSVDIPWFEADPAGGMVTAGGSSSVNARFNALDMPAGCHEAHLRVRNDTPYGTTIVPVDITVAFGDVPPGHIADGYIHGLAAALRSGGCGGGNFCPDDPLTRRAAARWLARAAYGADFLVSPATGQVFQDVAPDSFGAGEIELLAGKGVITGCSDDPARFCPMQSISRAELAVWQLRAREGADYVPPTCNGLFGDVPCAVTRDFPFADWIEDLATRVPATACTTDPLLFCPDTPVTRGEASIFTVGAFDLPICR